MSKKKKQRQTVRFLAATLAVSNLLGASAAAASLPAGSAAYSNEAFAQMQPQLLAAAQTETTPGFTASENVTVDASGNTVGITGAGDQFAVNYGLTEPVRAFRLEADVHITEGRSAALVFGIQDQQEPGKVWAGANVDYENGNDIFRVFGPGVAADGAAPLGSVDRSKPLHLALEVRSGGAFTYTFGNTGDTPRTITGKINGWEGGYVGFLTFESTARFSNIEFEKLPEDSAEDQEPEETVAPLADSCKVSTGFRSLRTEIFSQDNGTVRLGNASGDHIAIYDNAEKTKAFVLEADVTLGESDDPNAKSAGLLFGIGSKKTPASRWGAANVDTARTGADAFRLFGGGLPGDTNWGGSKGEIDFTKPLHLRLEIKENGDYIYHFGNRDTSEEEFVKRAIRGTIPNWQGGYVGLLSFRTEAVFSNIRYQDNGTRTAAEVSHPTVTGQFKTNITDLSAYGGSWTETADGLHSTATGQGDCFLYSGTRGGDFVYKTDVVFHDDTGAAALLFRNAGTDSHDDCYAVNLDAGSRRCKLWRWGDETDCQLMDESQEIPVPADGVYHLEVTAIGPWLSCRVNGELVASSGDYTLAHQYNDKGQNTVRKEGFFGLLNFNGDMTFQNTYFTPVTDSFTPLLNDITITSSAGTVEKRAQFVPTGPIMIQYVKNDASTVNVNAAPKNAAAKVTITDADGKVYPDGKNIPVREGKNWITVTSEVTNADGTKAAVTYRVDVHRRQADAVYYNEAYRDQYHYSVQDGWANDPNGMVYFNGKYHLFYQFYDDTVWGPMHWAHATSTDLLHWTEEPVALYPDANGAMFSGCIVADTQNTSGFFDGVTGGGLVALVTADGNGQRIKLAYSKDEGTTWTKVDEIAADWTDDPLAESAFRDPKVFRWENKWFMVVAGGPLRIYSSNDLKNWQCESTCYNLHTECPDLYPVRAEDGTLKWVLSRGGRYYKAGDFKTVGGKWRFVPDSAYEGNSDGAATNGVMNFGDDSYAAMTYYVQDFGTAANPTIPTITEINWMNTWAGEDYCRRVAETNGEKFNGTFNLNLDLGLVKENGKYLLTQTPVAGYESLRDTGNAVVIGKTTADGANAQLRGFQGDCYEIIASFTPSGNTPVGFDLRVGEGQKTAIRYDPAAKELSVDRTQSGLIVKNRAGNAPADAFISVDKQSDVELNADGSIDMHLYVDRASVELFAKGFTVAGANQIFPAADSLGLEVVGGASGVELTVYPMNSVWNTTASPAPANSGTAGSSSQATPVPNEQSEADVIAAAIAFVSQNGLMHGGDSGFAPNDRLTRSMMAQILHNLAGNPDSGSPTFPDVVPGSWFAGAAGWAVSQGLMDSRVGGGFAPNDPVSREQLAVMLYRFAQANGASSVQPADLSAYADSARTSPDAVEAVRWALGAGLLAAKANGRLDPAGQVTRAEMAQILMNFSQNIVKQARLLWT